MSLRLLLLRSSRTEQEQDIVNTMLTSYSSYKAGGRTRQDIALMLARDFMFMNLQAQPQIQQGHVHDQFNVSNLSSQMQSQHQQGQSFIYSPSHSSMGNPSNNMNHMPPPPGGGVKLENKSYNSDNLYLMHIQDQKHHLPIHQQHQILSPHQDSYTQQQDYTHIENCPDLNDLLSLPQDVMAAMTANVTAAAAAAAAAMESGNLQ